MSTDKTGPNDPYQRGGSPPTTNLYQEDADSPEDTATVLNAIATGAWNKVDE